MIKNKVEISSINTSELKLLGEGEAQDLMRRLKNGDKEAREKFVCGNLRLVLSTVQQFSGKKHGGDDLFQVGCVGLLKAVDNFDPEIGVKFSTYAVPMNVTRRNPDFPYIFCSRYSRCR